MKINLFISVVRAVSAWLHGEGGRYFRTYTYPRLKQATRTVINLGIYEKIENLYRIVDDTYYKGAIEITPQDPAEIARLEAYAAELDEVDGSLADGADTGVLPRFEDIRDSLLIWKGLEQGKTYRCATFTMNNMLRTAMLRRGLRPPLEVTAIDPLYIMTKAGKGQTGTVMNTAFKFLAKHGFPIPSWSPSMTDHDKELKALEAEDFSKNALSFVTLKATGNDETAYTYEKARELDATLPMTYEMQVSINFSASLKYFGQLVPFLQKVNGQYSLTRTGGHSVHGVRGSFSKWEDGEAGFAIIDSAYRSKEEGWRFLKASLFAFGVLTVRFVELAVDGAVVPAPVVPTPTPVTPQPITDRDTALINTNISFGDKNSFVTILQEYLIEEGWIIPSGATGYFGDETKAALKAWQSHNLSGEFTGTYWGDMSRNKYRELKGL